VTRHDAKRRCFAHVVAKNAANAVAAGESYLAHAPTASEVARDIVAARPLVRSDFAPLFDGGTAVLVARGDALRRWTQTPVEIQSIVSATDLSVIGDRADPLQLAAVQRAAAQALARADARASDVAFVDVDSTCSVLEVLALESAGLTEPGTTTAQYANGLGRPGSPLVINPGGGAQGTGLVFGTVGVAQAHEAFLQLVGKAGQRQVRSAMDVGARSLCISVSGLGTQAYAMVARRIQL
jgi:acetyl-CoA acetyltransferase